MPEPITLSLIIGAAVGGAAKALVGKAAEKTPELAQRAHKLVTLQETLPLSQYDAAVRGAVEAARQDLLAQYAAGDTPLPQAVVDDMTALLNHPPFAEEVARRLLYRGQPDWERLREAYLRRAGGDPAAASARWQALELPLSDFFDALQSRLTADREIGPLLRDAATLASLTRLEEMGDIVAQASRQVQDSLPALQAAAERGAGGIETLVQQGGQQTAYLAQIASLLAALQPAPAPATAGAAAAGVSAEEKATLRLLREECNRLPLAHDARAAGERGPRAELARVYVDLQTTSPPAWTLICDRLRIPAGERAALVGKPFGSREAATGADRAFETRRVSRPEAALAEALDVEALLRLGGREEFAQHPLRRWAKDEADLRDKLQPTTALEALAGQRRLVLLGQPGSGKTTLVNHLAYTLAGAALGEEPDWQAMLAGQFASAAFPLRVAVRKWSASLSVHSQPGLDLAYAALLAAGGLSDLARLTQRLESPDTLLFFDGLDEAPAGDPEAEDPANRLNRRRLVAQSVQALCVAHPACRVLVTSRIKPYEGEYRLEGLPVVTLAELDDPRIRRFAELWYAELARVGQMSREEAERKRSQLLAALGRRPVLRQMAGTPLLLTMLAKVNARKDLPESRAELYHDCVQQLLWEWERGLGVQSLDGLLHEALAEARKVDPSARLEQLDVEKALWRLAYDGHAQGGRRTAELTTQAVRQGLAAIHPLKHRGWAWASKVTALMQERGGLLVASDEETFTFPHPSFEEYLAARHLLRQEERNAAAARLAGSNDWREVVLLACGYLAANGLSSDLEGLIAELAACPAEEAEGWRAVLTAGQAWLEFGPRPPGSNTGKRLARDLPAQLTGLMQRRDLEASQRLAAGLLAADLGALPPDLDELVAAPDWGFAIGRYPVTNVQFRRFVDAGGYDQRQKWWTKQAIDEIKSWEGGRWPAGPRLWDDERFNHRTQPVVGVSWYEAQAYCAWLTEELRRRKILSAGKEVRLPTRAQWEQVARSSHGKAYPWGSDQFDPQRANTEESSLGQTTPVHMYPDGRTPVYKTLDGREMEGVYDLAGNVWEWTADLDKDRYPWLKGGAYWNDAKDVGASAADGLDPRSRLVDGGLRVVVVPVSRSGLVLNSGF